jgi:hypothetical protein
MRNYADIFAYHPSMIGTLSTIGGTAIGAPVCIQGFRDVLALLTAGAVFGSGTGSTITLAVKMQQSASATGTGAGWTDITPGDVNSTFAFTTLTFTGTDPAFKMEEKYERIGNAITGKFIRAHATLAGTVGLGPKFSVGFLLGRPTDTLYVGSATTEATGNVEYTKLL